MTRISEYIKKNHQRFLFSLCVNLFFLIVFNIFFYCRFHTVDDVFMEMIVCGAYGAPDPHLIYTNVILGFVLSTLYKLYAFVPWYGLMHIAMALLSLSTIMYVFLNKENKLVHWLAVLAIFIVSYEAYTKVQFTKTAAYLAAAGYLLIAHALSFDNDRSKLICGIFFLWNSFMIRTGMFLGCSAVCVACMLPQLLKSVFDLKDEKNKKAFFKIIKVGLCSLLLVGISYFVDKVAYLSPGWEYYVEFNSYTTQFQDIHFPSYELYEEEYKALGISEEDWALYASVDHNDPDLFGLDVMEKVKELQPYKTIDSNEVVMFFLRGYNTIFRQKTLSTFAFYTVMLLVLYLFFNKHNMFGLVSFFYAGFASVFAFAYIYFMHGWFDRTTLAVMSAFVFTFLYLFDLKQKKIVKRLAIAGTVSLLLVSVYSWNEYFRWNMKEWKENYDLNHEILDAIYEDKEHLYLSRTSLSLWKRYYHPYDIIRISAMGNYSPLGDWISNTPLSIKVLKRYDVVNPYKDMVNNKKVYLIGYRDNLQQVIDYISRHYYENPELVLIKKMGDYDVYSVLWPQE